MLRRIRTRRSPFATRAGAVSVAAAVTLTLVSALTAPAANADTPPVAPVYSSVQLEVGSAPGVPVPQGDVDLFGEQSMGRTQILTDEALCLAPPESGSPELVHCSVDDYPYYAVENSFLPVPVDATPDRTSSDHDDQWFRLVTAVEEDNCLSLQPGQSLYDVTSATCDASDPAQTFRAMEAPDPLGMYLGWQSILDLAVLGATTECTEFALNADEPARCKVAVSAHPDQWFDPGDANIHQYGVLGTKLLGCGTAAGPDGGTFFHNGSSSTITTSLTSSVSSTSSSTATTTYGSTTTLNVSGGVKDVFSVSLNEAFQYNTSSVTASSATQTTQSTVSGAVKPGEYLMTAWSEGVYTLDGLWKFGIAIAESSGAGLDWTIPATSSYPALTGEQEDYGLVSAITSAALKSCTATPPSTAVTRPAMTSDLTTCDDASPAAPSGEVGSWVYVCPGDWAVPPGSDPTPQFSYQWSITSGGGAPLIPLDGADESGFRIEPSTSGGKTVYLRVAVAEAVTSPTSRLASDYVLSPDEVTVNPAQVESPSAPAPVGFVDQVPHALVGSPYSASLVEPGSGPVSDVTASGVPDGFTVSSDGVLTGNPTSASTSTVVLTDAASGATGTLVLDALEPHPDFQHGPEISGTVGEPLSTSVVTPASVFSTLSVADGSLPPGLTLSTSGRLTGVPLAAGRFRVTLQSASGDISAVDVVIDDVATGYATALQPARAGEAYSAQTVARPGSRALYSFAEAAESTWVVLDTATGAVSGTPDRVGSTTFAVRNVLDPSEPAVVFVVEVDPQGSATSPSADPSTAPVGAPAASASGGPHGASLPATGTEPGIPLVLGILLAAVGVVLLTRSRRTASR